MLCIARHFVRDQRAGAGGRPYLKEAEATSGAHVVPSSKREHLTVVGAMLDLRRIGTVEAVETGEAGQPRRAVSGA